MVAPSRPRWFSLTPDRLVVVLLVLECLLLLSNWLGWWHNGCAVLVSIAVVGTVLLLMLLWFIAALVFRQRFQFGIRSLLLVLIVALPCSWLAVEMKRAKDQREAVAAIKKLGGCVAYSWGYQPEPAWLWSCLVDNFFAEAADSLGFDTRVTDEELAHIARLTELQRLWLDGTRVTDAGLVHLAGLPQLQVLSLSQTRVTGAGVAKLKKALWNCMITL
jgi:hypothetical protein